MKSLKYVVAAAVAAAALPGTAEAAEIITNGAAATTVQVADLDQDVDNSFSIGFSDAGLTNPFNELLTFTTDVAGMLSIRVDTIGTSSLNNVTFSDIILTGTGLAVGGISLLQVLPDPNDTFVVNNLQVGAGTYTLNIQGTPGTANGALSGNVAFTSMAAVPEPGTWAMMLLGFGAIGVSVRRRRSKALPQFA